MAAADGPAPGGLNPGPEDERLAFLRRSAPEARRFGVFALLRQAEAYARDLPRIGLSRLPSQNIADLSQAPILTFPGPTLDSVTVARGRASVRGHYLGLTGPMGALPLHLSEFAFYEERYARQRPFGRFLDLLAGRMLQFFYRAWADSQPAAQADRPEDDRFAHYVAQLTGAREGAGPSSAFPAQARLHYAALFASRRSVAGIQDALEHLLLAKVVVHPFEPRWREIEPADRTRLGSAGSGGAFNQLGADAVAGSRVRGVSDAYRVTVRTPSFRDYEAFLPTGPRFAIAAEAMDAFAPSHLEWTLELEIPAAEIRPARLDGRTRLGWTGWLGQGVGGGGREGRPALRADTRLRRSARPRRRRPADLHDTNEHGMGMSHG